MVRSQWKLMFGNKFVFAFYKKEQQLSFSSCKKVMVVKKQKWLGKLDDLKVKNKLSAHQKDMKLEDLGVTKRIGKNIPLYNKVQYKLRLQHEPLLKFVVKNPKKRDFLFKTVIKKNKINKGFSVNLVNFRLGFNLKNKDVYTKKLNTILKIRKNV